MAGNRGAPRKSRLTRLGFTAAGDRTDPHLSDEDWLKLQAACPFLCSEDKEAVFAIATTYLLFAPAESRAPFLRDAEQWLNTSLEATKAYVEVILQGLAPKDASVQYARSMVEQHIRHGAFPEGMKWSELANILIYLEAAFERGREDLKQSSAAGFEEGTQWEEMICRLTDFAKSCNYPIAAPKGVDKAKSSRTPPFVILVRELQRLFPEELRRATGSDIALAQAISVARRKRDQATGRKINAEGQPI